MFPVANALCDALSAYLARSCEEQPEHVLTLRAFCDDLAQVPATLPYQPAESPRVRGLSHVAEAASRATDSQGGELAEAARHAVGWATWTEYYREDDWSAGFVDRFANGDIVGPEATWRHDGLIVGLFVFGPDMLYPTHSHEAEELYCVLSGAPGFAVGLGARFEDKAPGDIIVHPGSAPHSIRTGSEPVFGVYAWRGNVGAPTWYLAQNSRSTTSRRYPGIVRR